MTLGVLTPKVVRCWTLGVLTPKVRLCHAVRACYTRVVPLDAAHARRVRRVILARDGHICLLNIPGVCRSRGRPLSADKLHVDHIIESRAGGSDAYSNLQTACKWCNEYKSGGRNGVVAPNRVRL